MLPKSLRKTVLTAKLGLLGLVVSGAAQATTVLTMSNWIPPTSAVSVEVFDPWVKKVEQATEGRVKIRILPKAVGSPPQHFELARKGIADITWGYFTYEPQRFVSVWFAEMPFGGTDASASSRALWRTYEKFLKGNAAFNGVEMLATGTLGGGTINHHSTSVIEPEDLKGQKIRMGGPIQKRLLEELGAIPIARPAPQVYELLESGVVDGSLHSIESVVTFNLQDHLREHTFFKDALYDAAAFIVINDRSMKKLSAQDQQAIRSVSQEALSAMWGESFDLHNTNAINELKSLGHGMNVPSEKLSTRVAEIREKMVAEWVEAAKKAGVEDPAAMLEFYNKTYRELAGS